MWFRVFILIACSTNIIHSNQISSITKIGPCTAELDDKTVIDLSKINFYLNLHRIFYSNY
jgi:hypothetical protein